VVLVDEPGGWRAFFETVGAKPAAKLAPDQVVERVPELEGGLLGDEPPVLAGVEVDRVGIGDAVGDPELAALQGLGVEQVMDR
jgi:hypothetical protein